MSQSGTVEETEALDKCVEFLKNYYEEEVAQLAQRYPNDQSSLTIDWMDVNKYDPHLADDLRTKPGQLLEYFEEALRLYDLPIDRELSDADVRVYGLPETNEFNVGETRADHREDLLAIRGQITKASDIKPKANMIAYECQRCGTLTRIPQDTTERQDPHECSGCERQGPFTINYGESDLTDHRLIRLQEPPELAKGGNGSTIDVVLEGDIVEQPDPGDRITATGILELSETSDDTLTFDKHLFGKSIEVEETDFEDIQVDKYEDEIKKIASGDCGDPIELMAKSIAPKIHGHDKKKEAVALQLIGGTHIDYPTGERDRGDFHVLMIGDPGCGKSTILDAAKEIAPRSTKASGKGATKSGMTAAAVRDDFGETEWGLEAGALVLADKGIACVDEIDKVSEDAVSSLHNALESQEVEINKAGINATLPARTSLLAAGNPKYGRFDTYEPVGEQLDLSPTLLSRFDLIFLLSDQPNVEKDEAIARHNVNIRRSGNEYTHNGGSEPDDAVKPEIPLELFRAYIAYAKQNYHPQLTEDSEEKLIDWYTTLRQEAADNDEAPIPITPRYIEALQRVSEASARARLSHEVEEQDMERAIDLVLQSMRDVGMDPETGEFDADVIETGTSKSQRDRIKNIKDIISHVEEEYDTGAPHGIVIDRAQEEGIKQSKAEHEIENLLDQGEIYQPYEGNYRTT